MASNDETSVLLHQWRDRIAIVTINRPHARNAIDASVAVSLEEILEVTEKSPNINVVVLTGAGGHAFSAGADLKEVAAGNLPRLFRDRGGFAGFVHAQRRKPWIAAVNGVALAGGCEIALACDLIVASESAEFGLPEVSRGLVASAGGLYRLTRALPKAIAIELILTAGRLSARRAMDFGLINHIAEEGGAVEVACELALKIAANAPLAVRESLAIAKMSHDLAEEKLKKLSEDAQIRLMSTKDYIEGPRAFIERRVPNWSCS